MSATTAIEQAPILEQTTIPTLARLHLLPSPPAWEGLLLLCARLRESCLDLEKQAVAEALRYSQTPLASSATLPTTLGAPSTP